MNFGTQHPAFNSNGIPHGMTQVQGNEYLAMMENQHKTPIYNIAILVGILFTIIGCIYLMYKKLNKDTSGLKLKIGFFILILILLISIIWELLIILL